MKELKTVTPLVQQPGKALVPGLIGHYLHGQSMTLGVVEIKAGSLMDIHSHPHEQITYILEGELQMKIGEEDYLLSAGMSMVIPSHTLHGAQATVDCKVLDVFAPVRDDYRQ